MAWLFHGRRRNSTKRKVKQVKLLKQVFIVVKGVDKGGIVAEKDGVDDVINSLKGHHDSHTLVHDTLGQDVCREDVEEAQNLFVVFLENNTCDEAYDTLKSIYDEISELHENAVKKIEP